MSYLVDIRAFPETLKELERLLSYRLLSGSLSIQHYGLHLDGHIRKKQPISEWIEILFNHCNEGNIAYRQNGLCRIAALIQDLKVIEDYDPELLKYFQIQFKKCSGNSFWGLRFEIDVASSIIGKDISFVMGKDLAGGDNRNGDFVINGNIAIECTTTHISSPKFSSLLYKIESAVRSKSKKPYCNEHTALFIDISNIFYNRALQNIPICDTELRECLRNLMRNYNFGSIVASLWFFNKDLNDVVFQNLFIREDNPNISNSLKLFLSDDFSLNMQLDPIGKFDALHSY